MKTTVQLLFLSALPICFCVPIPNVNSSSGFVLHRPQLLYYTKAEEHMCFNTRKQKATLWAAVFSREFQRAG